jgi:hypothetical protein
MNYKKTDNLQVNCLFSKNEEVNQLVLIVFSLYLYLKQIDVFQAYISTLNKGM